MSTPTLRGAPRLRAHRRPIEHARAGQLAAEEQIGRHVEARDEVELLEDRGDAGRLRGARIGEPRAAPSIRISPASGSITPERMFISVDLPAPFSPSSAWISPRSRSKSTPAERLDAAEMLDDAAHGEQRRGRVQRRLARKRAHPQIGWRGGAATPAASPRRIRRFFLLRDDAPSETKSVPAASALSATSSPISAFAP